MIWIPEHERKLWEEFQSKMTEEDRRRTAYFFWNNFSYDGYDDYKKKLEDGKIEKFQDKT